MNSLSMHQSLHPMQWVMTIAVTLLCVTGIAAITGVLPASKYAEPPAPGQPAATSPAAAAPAVAVPAPTVAAPTPVTKVVIKHVTVRDEPRPLRSDSRATFSESAYVSAPAPATCQECGFIESVQWTGHENLGSGLGAVAGGLIGGGLGNRIGQGNGRTVATVAGLISGAMIGHNVENARSRPATWQTVVRFEDGNTRVFNSPNEPIWRSGERVRLINGYLQPI